MNCTSNFTRSRQIELQKLETYRRKLGEVSPKLECWLLRWRHEQLKDYFPHCRITQISLEYEVRHIGKLGTDVPDHIHMGKSNVFILLAWENAIACRNGSKSIVARENKDGSSRRPGAMTINSRLPLIRYFLIKKPLQLRELALAEPLLLASTCRGPR